MSVTVMTCGVNATTSNVNGRHSGLNVIVRTGESYSHFCVTCFRVDFLLNWQLRMY